MKEELYETEIVGEKSTADIAWTGTQDGPMNIIGREFPFDLSGRTMFPAGDGERLANRAQVLDDMGINTLDTVVPKVQHGSFVRYVQKHNPFVDDVQCDGLVADVPGLVLTMPFADCPSVVLFDDTARVLGLLHAGWRPIAANVVENGIDLMRQLGAHRSRLSAFIGPGVRKCCYEVDPITATAVDGLMHHGHVHIDLSDIITARLVARGVDIERIASHPTCTCCGVGDNGKTKKPLYYSYRREKTLDPLNANMLVASFS